MHDSMHHAPKESSSAIQIARSLWSSPPASLPNLLNRPPVEAEGESAAGPSPNPSKPGNQNNVVQNSPLQSLLDAAPNSDGGGVAGGLLRRGRDAVLQPPRMWSWYDADDERAEQTRERSGKLQRFVGADGAGRLHPS